METKLVVFKDKEIRRTLQNDEWWFSVVGVCGVLTESKDAGAYWRKLKQRLKAEGSEVVTNCHGLKLVATDGEKRQTDCANTEGVFRIIQSILSPKAEPFKRSKNSHRVGPSQLAVSTIKQCKKYLILVLRSLFLPLKRAI